MADNPTHPAEEALLGAILLDPGKLAEIRTVVPADNFTHPKHRRIYEAMLSLSESKQAIDIPTLAVALGEKATDSMLYLSRLMDAVITSANWRTHARIVSEAATRVKAQRLLDTLSDMLTSGDNAMAGVIDAFQTGVLDLNRGLVGPDRATKSYSQVMDGVLADLEYRIKHGVKGIPTGFYGLDDLTDGLQPGQVWFISAYTSRGKSIFVEQIAQNAAKKGHPVLFESIEMSARATGTRSISRVSGVDSQQIRRAILGADERSRIVAAAGELSELPIWLRDTDNNDLYSLLNNARAHRLSQGIEVLVVDYIQLIDVQGIAESDVRVRVNKVSKSFKALSKELGITILVVTQQNRPSDPRTKADPTHEPRPSLSGLKESSAQEMDADVVVLLHRPDFLKPDNWNQDGTQKGLGILAKQREGPAQVDFELVFDKRHNRWLNPGDAWTPQVSIDSEAGES